MLGTATTGDIGAATASGGMPSTANVSNGGTVGSSSSSTSGTSNVGGSAGSDLGGAAGENGEEGASSMGGTSTSSNGGSSGGIGGSGGGGGNSGTGGPGGNGPCGNDAQCASQQCDDGLCRLEHCGNGEPDADETDIDCGGTECRPCGYEQHCLNDADCATADCDEASETCRPTLVIYCVCNSMGNCNQTPLQTTVDLQLQNTGTEPIDLPGLRFHYYYSSAGTGADEVMCDQINLQGATCAWFDGEASETEYDDTTASDEVVFSFTDGRLAPGAMTGSIRFSINNDVADQRSDDYSFDNPQNASGVMCERIVATNVDDVPLWGLPPD